MTIDGKRRSPKGTRDNKDLRRVVCITTARDMRVRPARYTIAPKLRIPRLNVDPVSAPSPLI